MEGTLTRYTYYPWTYASDIGNWLLLARCRSIVATGTGRYPGEDVVYPGVYFGSGSTPANKNDVTLESPITSGLNIINPASLGYSNDGNGKYTVSADYVLRNDTNADIILREVGIFTPTTESNVSGSFTADVKLHLCLMERTVLAEPITIHPGESKLVTYKITFNHVLNVE